MSRTAIARLQNGLTNEAIHAELDRILSSATFIRSKRLGRFLRFTVEQCLEGRQNSLKEYLVGVEVFNKLETFDPRIDSIVRVEARRLRSKLERYYQTEGREDQIVIQFRKGSYVPMIMTREQYQANGYRRWILTLAFRQEIDRCFTIHEPRGGSGVLIFLLRTSRKMSSAP